MSSKRREELTLQQYVDGIRTNNRAILARAITLVESNAKRHFSLAQDVLTSIMPYTGKSMRIGITGVPGAGKSTFIEALGMMLAEKGHRVAVLAIDPSSTLSQGSILGDKTRMEQLSRHVNAFVRPSPAGGTLGGVARKTRETLLLCEAAGYDIIIVETVGVGQSEITVRSMVDCFLLLMLTGAGDELQGMKKGIMELVDIMFINKADGENLVAAEKAKIEFQRILHMLPGTTEGWITEVRTVSALTGNGIEECWESLIKFQEHMKATNQFEERRKQQAANWFHSLLEEQILKDFYNHTLILKDLQSVKQKVISGETSATKAALSLLEKFRDS
ncbi:methylmalonyl Co-A mutase-associated GTPase MeaB [Halalkalibacter akibai]|uniref:Putative periplasmic protein kinase ArgK and related GTPases of G3E family n=1 Tax=Halalkalibacter akibai (strain ATCC 43226 / DSM 21942 / CIP 109018 / JCM 9157 / 1139) TaxID=1236973 RepID=W4QUU0_HALA3|nr:methylmalonyl Co-A mutase-associated GTPase MeaB [Halalkalibacter akibai]GAE35388.1 putative periplasmic protein kinase ArgK and related GTPases of G3E family [Halalkalibacter akibai JCM 9157]